jgi:hypothetical protein
MSTRKLGSRLVLLACLAIGACTTDATQVIVLVDAETALRADIDHLHLRVQGRDALDDDAKVDKLDETMTGKISWPVKLALAPAGDDASRIFWVEATALDGSTVLATARLLSGYIDGETRYAKLLIEAACRDVSCTNHDDTCHDGTCVDAFRAPDALGKSAKGATNITEPDGGFPAQELDASSGDTGMPEPDAGMSDAGGGGTDAALPSARPARTARPSLRSATQRCSSAATARATASARASPPVSPSAPPAAASSARVTTTARMTRRHSAPQAAAVAPASRTPSASRARATRAGHAHRPVPSCTWIPWAAAFRTTVEPRPNPAHLRSTRRRC